MARRQLNEEECVAWRKERRGYEEWEYEPAGRANWDKSQLRQAYMGCASWAQSEGGMWHIDFDAFGGPDYRGAWLKAINDTSACLNLPRPRVQIAFNKKEPPFQDSARINIFMEAEDDDELMFFFDCLTKGWAKTHGGRLAS